MKKKILLLTGDFTEDLETFFPYQALKMVGYQVDCIAPHKKKGSFVVTAVHDFEKEDTYSEKRGHNFIINADFESIKCQDYIALVLPGGRAPEYLRLDQRVLDIVSHFMSETKPIAAICHGIQILNAAKVVKNKKLTAYPTVGPEVIMAGGEYISVDIDDVVVDGNMVTAPAWPAHPKWMAAFLNVLGVSIKL